MNRFTGKLNRRAGSAFGLVRRWLGKIAFLWAGYAVTAPSSL
ncbi:MAG TPA: hypothetical protein VE077_03845 [Candidatus Methylomirabilis sp.]|nr:hypothetical protein [Candidatus Methylomirabilis sp.]